MNFVCKLCMKNVKYDVLASIGTHKIGDKSFCEVLGEICAVDASAIKLTQACQSCVHSVESFFNFQNNLKTNLQLPENKILSDVKQFIKESSEETSLMTINKCLVLTPKSKVDEMMVLKYTQGSIKHPKITLDRLNIVIQKDDDDDEEIEEEKEAETEEVENEADQVEHVAEEVANAAEEVEEIEEDVVDLSDTIVMKMEPVIEINDDSGFSTDTSSKWSLDDLTTREKQYISENIRVSQRKSSNAPARTARCRICDKYFPSRQKTARHIQRDHLMKKGSKLMQWMRKKIQEGRINENGRRYKCVICEKTDTSIIFNKALDLRNHLSEHKKSANFTSLLEDEAEAHYDASARRYDHPFGFLVSIPASESLYKIYP